MSWGVLRSADASLAGRGFVILNSDPLTGQHNTLVQYVSNVLYLITEEEKSLRLELICSWYHMHHPHRGQVSTPRCHPKSIHLYKSQSLAFGNHAAAVTNFPLETVCSAPWFLSSAAASCSAANTSLAAFWFSQLRYVCQPTAIQPENTLRNCAGTYMKLKAVTAGQSFTLFWMLTGKAFFNRSHVSSSVAPARSECTLKKYVLKTGVKNVCCTTTLVKIERILLE